MTEYVYTHVGTLKAMVTGSNYTKRIALRETERSWVTNKGVAYDKIEGLNAFRGHNMRLLLPSITRFN